VTDLTTFGASGSLNGTYVLNGTTVTGDAAAADTLYGRTDFDWFLASAEDTVADLDTTTPPEQLTSI
jgi:hypothetical protein